MNPVISKQAQGWIVVVDGKTIEPGRLFSAVSARRIAAAWTRRQMRDGRVPDVRLFSIHTYKQEGS